MPTQDQVLEHYNENCDEAEQIPIRAKASVARIETQNKEPKEEHITKAAEKAVRGIIFLRKTCIHGASPLQDILTIISYDVPRNLTSCCD